MSTLKKVYFDHPGISATITVVIMMGLLHFTRLLLQFSYEMNFIVAETIVAVIMTTIIYMINGEGKLLFSTKGLGYAFKLGWWPLVLGISLSVLMIGGSLIEGTPTNGNPFLIILGAVILSIFVGYFEEGLFRGVVLNAFLSRLGDTHRGILMSCIYSSIIFGFVHVYSDFLGFFTNPATFSFLALAQVIGKTISTALFGFILAVIFIKTHNLLAVAVIHAINDLGPFLPTFLYDQSQSLTQYVSADSGRGLIATIFYIFQGLFVLPAVIYAYRQLKNVPIPQWGMFRHPWYPQKVEKNK